MTLSKDVIAFDFTSPRVKIVKKDRKPRALNKCSLASYITDIVGYTDNIFYATYWHKSHVHYGEMAEKLYTSCLEKGIKTIGQPKLNQPISKFM